MTNEQVMEVEANAFAMEFLIPHDWLVRDVHAMGGIDIEDDKKVKKLADRYKVSLQVMTVRLGQILESVKS